MAYKELTKAWEVMLKGSGSYAIRELAEVPPGVSGEISSVPNIGSAHPTEPTLSLAENKITLFGGMPNLKLHRLLYLPTAVTPRENTPPIGSSPISGSIGGEILSIDGKKEDSPYVWYGTSDPVSQVIPRTVITIPFKVPKRLSALPLTWLKNSAGKINSDTLTVHGTMLQPGTVLFEGATFTEYRNEQNLVRYRVELNFTLKEVPIEGDATGGWLYLLDESDAAGLFKEVSPPLYKSVALSPIYNMAETI